MAEYIERNAAIAALNKVRDDQRVFKYATASDFLSARDAIERATKVLESLPAAERRMIMTEFISRNYGNEGYEIIIKTDSHEHYRAAEDFARRLIDHSKPVTNAQKIRAMSDEELSKVIREPFCDKRTHEECTISYCGVCDQCVLDWLQQQAGVEE